MTALKFWTYYLQQFTVAQMSFIEILAIHKTNSVQLLWSNKILVKRKWNSIPIQKGFLVFYVVSNNSIDRADIILLGMSTKTLWIT